MTKKNEKRKQNEKGKISIRNLAFVQLAFSELLVTPAALELRLKWLMKIIKVAQSINIFLINNSIKLC